MNDLLKMVVEEIMALFEDQIQAEYFKMNYITKMKAFHKKQHAKILHDIDYWKLMGYEEDKERAEEKLIHTEKEIDEYEEKYKAQLLKLDTVKQKKKMAAELVHEWVSQDEE